MTLAPLLYVILCVPNGLILITEKWNISKVVKNDVYEPAEDTFLLIDAIEDDVVTILHRKPKIILEVGCGSGVVIAALSSIFKNAAYCMAIDIFKNACSITKDTAQLNNVQVDVLNDDLLSSLRPNAMIDIIIFNPPYVRTDTSETKVNGISRSWAGGISGREVMDRIFQQLHPIISENGLFYLLVIDYNMVDDVIGKVEAFGFIGTLIKKRQIRGELLSVLRFVKT